MEMAGVVTYTGAKIIQNAHKLIEQIGKPLELDTDGIWCCLPGSFPENFVFKTSNPQKKIPISYPCVMLNVDVAVNNTNDQYQTMVDPVSRTYAASSECSIEFEVDGPYKAMILPASKEEGVLIKKRYAVFNDDGTLAELKGFEIKRRGELKLIKVFQAEVFENFLQGDTLEECYAAVGEIANRWLDMLENKGVDLADSELLDYISESSTMSKSLEDYGDRKSCAMTTARRLADFLGDAMIKDKGLSCRYIVAKDPQGSPVSERAIPVAIFEAEPAIMKAYLKKWCKSSSDVVFRSIVDWAYYRQRLSSAIQKIITIPAAMQKVSNPVPRVAHPEWLWKKVREKDDKYRQKSLTDMFQKKPTEVEDALGDLEDMCSSGWKHRPMLSSKPHGKVDSDVETKVQEITSIGQEEKSANEKTHTEAPVHVQNMIRSKSPDRGVDYQAWLEHMKLKWKEIRDKRKRLRDGGSAFRDEGAVRISRNVALKDGRGKRKAGVGAMFRSQQATLTRSHWQLLQLAPNQSPGYFSAWILVDGDMYKVQIQVPRVFYLNTRAPPGDDSGKRVNRVLPHMKPCFNLLEVVCDEAQFKDAKRFLSAHLADPDVEGVYETKISPLQQAVLRVGCVCTVDVKASKRNVNDGWSVDELHMKTTAESPYLRSSLNFFFLYESSMDTRGLFALYIPAAEKILVVVVNPRNNKEVSSMQLEKQFRDAARNSSVSNLESSNWTVKVEYVPNNQDAGRLIQRSLGEFRDQHRGPIIALSQCPSFELLSPLIPLLTDFPCVQIPCNTRDSQYQALGWQPLAARVAMHRCVASSVWLQERISLARYAHVPLGNIDFDWLLFTADNFFARALRDNHQVLWSSDDGIPDLGGALSDENTSSGDEVQQPAVSFPGAYRNVTIEFKIHHLAVNALLKSSQLSEFEGGSIDAEGSLLSMEGENSWNEEIFCSPAFRVLKQLVSSWLVDAISTGNNFSDALLQHVYRWLCSPQSKLHDPALQRVLHKVMQKVFALLLLELRKLGAIIVFADFNRIIIATSKSDINTAQGYCEYLLKTVKARELFEWIDLRPKQYWHSLLFMDQHNYGGIRANISTDKQSSDMQQDQSDSQDSTPEEIVSYWNIAEYLPKVTQDYFVVIVSEYIYIPWKYARDEAAKRREGPVSCTPSITLATAVDVEAGEILFLKDKVKSHFTEKLLQTVRDVRRHMNTKNYDENEDLPSVREFPKLAGSHLEMNDAALELIKHVCAVFMLDQRVQHEVLVLRKNLLKLIRVREFSHETAFRDPCLSFILPNVICSYCNDCRDLDLCRDAALLERDWCCVMPLCGQPYNCEWVENALLQIVRKRERLYHLQDLVCVKCRQVKASHLAEQCTCAGNFRCRESPADFFKRMRVFQNISEYYGFDLLYECVSWILEHVRVTSEV